MFAVYSQSREMDNVISLAVLLLATSTLLEAIVLAGDNSVLEVWLTTGDGHKKLSHESSVHASQGTNGGQLVTVDRNRHYQTVDGFGAAISNSAAYVIYHSPQRHEIMQTLFGSSGIGISYIRLTMGGSDLQAVPPYTYDDLPSGVATDFNLDHFSIAKDREFIIPILKEAISINPKLKILGSPWTAPAWMKTSHSLFGGAFRAEDRANATLNSIQKECARYVDNFARCVDNNPDAWNFVCEKQSIKLAKCSEEKSPIVVRAKMDCAMEYEKFNTCMDRNFSKTEMCRPEYQIFSDCVSAVQQRLKDNHAS